MFFDDGDFWMTVSAGFLLMLMVVTFPIWGLLWVIGWLCKQEG